MDELISRNELIKAFMSRQRSDYEVKNHTIPAEDVLSLIQNAPAVTMEYLKAKEDAEREAWREAMRLDDYEDTYKYRGHA